MIDPSRRLLTAHEAAEQLGITMRTLQKYRIDKTGPRVLTLGQTARPRIRYRQSDIDEWLETS